MPAGHDLRGEDEKALRFYLAECDSEGERPAKRLIFVPDGYGDIHLIFPGVEASEDEGRQAQREAEKIGIPEPVPVPGTGGTLKLKGFHLVPFDGDRPRLCLSYGVHDSRGRYAPTSKLVRALLARDLYCKGQGRNLDVFVKGLDRYRPEPAGGKGLLLNGFKPLVRSGDLKGALKWSGGVDGAADLGGDEKFSRIQNCIRRLILLTGRIHGLRCLQMDCWPGEPLWVEDHGYGTWNAVVNPCWLGQARGDSKRREFQGKVLAWLADAVRVTKRAKLDEMMDRVFEMAESRETEAEVPVFSQKKSGLGNMGLLDFLRKEHQKYRGDVVSGFLRRWARKIEAI